MLIVYLKYNLEGDRDMMETVWEEGCASSTTQGGSVDVCGDGWRCAAPYVAPLACLSHCRHQ